MIKVLNDLKAGYRVHLTNIKCIYLPYGTSSFWQVWAQR